MTQPQQLLDRLDAIGRSVAATEQALALIREISAPLANDRPLGGDIEAVAALALAGRLKP